MSLDKKLRDTEFIKRESWGKMIHMLKKQFDFWVAQELIKRKKHDFKLAHMPFIMNIAPEGTNNNELAKRARVTKQAMSKVAKELQQLGYIEVESDNRDRRVTIFRLTERGKKFVIEARLCVKDLMDEYRQVIGKNRFDGALQTMIEIIEYNNNKYYGGN